MFISRMHCSSHVREDHNHQIFGVQFNPFLDRGQPQVFATVGKDRVSIYECERSTGQESCEGIRLLQVYADPDVSTHHMLLLTYIIVTPSLDR